MPKITGMQIEHLSVTAKVEFTPDEAKALGLSLPQDTVLSLPAPAPSGRPATGLDPSVLDIKAVPAAGPALKRAV